MSERAFYGMTAEFASPGAVVEAARRLRVNGFRRMDAFTPAPVEGLDEALYPGRLPLLPVIIFFGGFLGAIAGYFIQYWAAVINYPINVGGRPFNSWPAFGVSNFEITVLFAVAVAFARRRTGISWASRRAILTTSPTASADCKDEYGKLGAEEELAFTASPGSICRRASSTFQSNRL